MEYKIMKHKIMKYKAMRELSSNKGQVSILGIVVILAVLSSTFSAIAQMHWSFLKIKARSQVYLCHTKMAEEIKQFIHFIGGTNHAIRALSLIPPTPVTAVAAAVAATKIAVLKRGLQHSQKIHALSFQQKLRAQNMCSLKNVVGIAQESPYRNFRRHPVDGTLILEKPAWSYQLQASIGGLLKNDFEILLQGSFKLGDRFGNFKKGKLYEVL